LLSEQLNSLKEHIVGCAHCQALLAQLEATDQISLQAAEQVEVFAEKESDSVMTARNLESFPAAAAPSQSQRALRRTTQEVTPGSSFERRAMAVARSRGSNCRRATRLDRAPRKPAAGSSKLEGSPDRDEAGAPSPAPPVSTAAQAVSPSPKAVLKKPQSAVDEFAGADTRSAADAVKSTEKQQYLARVSPSKPLADKEAACEKTQGATPPLICCAPKIRPILDAKTIPGAKQENAEVQMQAQAANVQSQNQSNSNSKIPGPAPLGQAETKKMKAASAAPAAPPSQPAAVGGAATSYNGSASLEVAREISNPRLISPPGSSVIWRAGRSGLIEFSKDGGASGRGKRAACSPIC